MAADLEHRRGTLASRVQGDLHLLRSMIREVCCKYQPLLIRVLNPMRAPWAPSSIFCVEHSSLWNLVRSSFEQAWSGTPDALMWIRVCGVFFFFSIGDKWKEHCVTSACRIVRTVMLSVVGGVSLPWWCVFLKLLVLNALCGAHTQLAVYHLRYTARAAPRDWLCVWVPACLRFVTLLCHRLFPITNKGYGTELWSYVVPFDCCFATASWKLQ